MYHPVSFVYIFLTSHIISKICYNNVFSVGWCPCQVNDHTIEAKANKLDYMLNWRVRD